MKRRLRSLYENFTRPRVFCDLKTTLGTGAGYLEVAVDGLPSLQILETVYPDLRLHCEPGEHAPEMKAFLGVCRTLGCLVDVGSHNGFFSLLFARSHEGNRVLAFEPSLDLRTRAEHMAGINGVAPRVEFSDTALGAESGPADFFQDPASGFVQKQAFAGHEAAGFLSVKIAMSTLDEECQRRGFFPTVLKIDVEGYEWEVLRGAEETLRRYRPVIFLELHLGFLEERGMDPKELLIWMKGLGYEWNRCGDDRSKGMDVLGTWASVVRLVARSRGNSTH